MRRLAVIASWCSRSAYNSHMQSTTPQRITVHIKPNTRHHVGVVAHDDGSLTVLTKARAVDNQANQEAAKLIADHFGVAKSRVTLLKGHTSRRKIFVIQ